MKKSIQTLFFVLLSTQLCFAQWTWQNPLPSGCPLNDVCFVNSNVGFAVGECGTILKTTDGGENWLAQSGFENYHFTSVHFNDANKGTVVGYDWKDTLNFPYPEGIILRTADGGNNWISQKKVADRQLKDVHFTDSNNGWIVGGGWWGSSQLGIICKTADGGEKWMVQLNDSTIPRLNGVYFTDNNTGTAVGEVGTILRTSDGGINWMPQNSGTTAGFTRVFMLDKNDGWIVGWVSSPNYEGIILKTNDGGNTWIRQETNQTVKGLNDVIFTDVNNGFAVGTSWMNTNSALVLRTSDGGENWVDQSIPADGKLNGISLTDINTAIVVGTNNDYSGGIILRTTNGGVTFVEEQVINETQNGFLLSQNYPNPFNTDTKIKYSVAKSLKVTLKVFDIHGKVIDILVNEEKPAGTYEVTWNAGNLSGGVYFYQLNSGGLIETRKMILRK
jgi:photosystem II stability/assembly factor-like uncharacterized protein